MIGTAIEWYDFYVYSTSVTLVLGALFFPSSNSVASSLIAFSTIGVGFIARPFGGLLLAHFGDRVGRKNTLLAALIVMGVATVAIGCLPTYAQIGVAAPIALVVLRFIQGMAVGGEWGGAVLLAVESAPPKKRIFYGTFPQFGSPIGLLGSSLVILLVQLLPKQDLDGWGWRIPFLLSAVLVVIGIVIRLRLDEPDEFQHVKDAGERARVPLVEVVKHFPRAVIIGTGAAVVGQSAYILVSFLPAYAKSQGYVTRTAGATALMLAAACGIVLMTLLAFRAENADRRWWAFWGGVIPAAWAFPAFLLTQWLGNVGLIIAVVVAYLGVYGYYTVMGSLLADQFPPEVRYTGISLCYQLAALLAGGLLPIATSALVASVGNAWWPAAALMVITSLLTALSAPFLRRSAWTGTEEHAKTETAQTHSVSAHTNER
jgi:MFS transporter, MHS family, shikimate and dehydroshikimate transport protein